MTLIEQNEFGSDGLIQPIKNNYDQKLLLAIMHPLFATVDNKLRRGVHISEDDIENAMFIQDYFDQLQLFYKSYRVDLIRAAENFYYLRPKSTSIINISLLNELDMLVGKILCYLYLSPERLAQQGIFAKTDVFDELTSLIDVRRLIKIIGQRRNGSDIDREKLVEKLGGSIKRMASLGFISMVNENRFTIHQSCFRFGADVRTGENPLDAQTRLITLGEISTPESIKHAEKLKNAVVSLENEFELQIDEEDVANRIENHQVSPMVIANIERTKNEILNSSNDQKNHSKEDTDTSALDNREIKE